MALNTSHAMVGTDVLETLRKYDSPTVSNVLELFDIRPHDVGYLRPGIRNLSLPPGNRVVGYASTATFRSSRPAEDERMPAGLLRHLEAMNELPIPRIVVFQDLDEPCRSAGFGELMARVYQNFEVQGIISNGAARDLDAIRAIGLGVWARNTCVSHGYGRILDVHTKVQIGPTVIRPGDLIHADENGVVQIPLEVAAEVASLCGPWVEAEQTYLAEIGQLSDPAIVAKALSNLQAAIRDMRPRVSSSAPELA